MVEVFFLGTFAPFARASDKPIAIACLRDLTGVPALPDFAVPFLYLRISFSTSLPADGLYFLVEPFALAFFDVEVDFARVVRGCHVVSFFRKIYFIYTRNYSTVIYYGKSRVYIFYRYKCRISDCSS